jgi:hypothetical protein
MGALLEEKFFTLLKVKAFTCTHRDKRASASRWFTTGQLIDAFCD